MAKYLIFTDKLKRRKFMKKKLLFITLMIALFICLFVLSASAIVTTYDDAPVRTKYQVSTNDVIEFYDGFICPTGYVFKDQSTVPAGSYNNPATLPGSLDFSTLPIK
jgi:hypothetical protein